MKLKTKLIVGAISLGMTLMPALLLQSSLANAATADIAINESTFPDPIFRDYVAEICDQNHNGYLSQSERNQFREIWLQDQYCGIGSLEGIQVFNPKGIYINNPTMATLDLSSYSELQWVIVADTYGVRQTTINFGNLANLKNVTVDQCNVSSIDLSGCPNLEILQVTNSGLDSLILGDKPHLQRINLDNNSIGSLDLTGMTEVRYLSARNNGLTNVVLGSSPYMYEVHLEGNNLTEIAVSADSKLNDILKFGYLN